jgi:hypothetical protein
METEMAEAMETEETEMADDPRQREIIHSIRSFASQILSENPLDTSPATAARIDAVIVRMAQLRSHLDRGQEPYLRREPERGPQKPDDPRIPAWQRIMPPLESKGE